jgi:hypothetical protein
VPVSNARLIEPNRTLFLMVRRFDANTNSL